MFFYNRYLNYLQVFSRRLETECNLIQIYNFIKKNAIEYIRRTPWLGVQNDFLICKRENFLYTEDPYVPMNPYEYIWIPMSQFCMIFLFAGIQSASWGSIQSVWEVRRENFLRRIHMSLWIPMNIYESLFPMSQFCMIFLFAGIQSTSWGSIRSVWEVRWENFVRWFHTYNEPVRWIIATGITVCYVSKVTFFGDFFFGTKVFCSG